MAVKKFHFKKPPTPYKARPDGHTYVRLNGGPLDGGWLRKYGVMQPTFSAFGASYELMPNQQIDPAFPEECQVGFVFIGYDRELEVIGLTEAETIPSPGHREGME